MTALLCCLLHWGKNGSTWDSKNWEDAAHDLPNTPPGTQHPAIRTWWRDEVPSLQLVMSFSSCSIKTLSLECLYLLTPATWVKSIQAWISHSSHLLRETPPCMQHSWENYYSLQSNVLAELGYFYLVVLAAGFYFMHCYLLWFLYWNRDWTRIFPFS